MPKAPPNRITVQVNEEDVEKNIVDIVRNMEQIRKLCLTDLQMADDTKLGYLRLVSELASSLEPKLEVCGALPHARRLVQYLDRDPLLLRYDYIQDSFWDKRQPNFRNLLDRISILLLRDDFTSTSQAYHVFQGIKYLHASDDREAVYDTIIPFNSLLSESGLGDPVVARFVMEHLFHGYMEQSNSGMGLAVGDKALTDPGFLSRLRELGALHVDLPHGLYAKVKRQFPNAVVIEDGNDKKTRVFLRGADEREAGNMFDFFADLAVKEMGDEAEQSIKPGIRSHFHFGKKFVDEVEEMLGVDTRLPDKKNLRSGILTLDDIAAEDGAHKTQDQWIQYWNGVQDGRWFPSMADMYQVFKQIVASPEEYAGLLQSLRTVFDKRWLLTSTRLQYNPKGHKGNIIHRFGSDSQEDPSNLVIPLYWDTPISDALDTTVGLVYMQTLLGTEDRPEEIMRTLEVIGDKPTKDIRLWTSPLESDVYMTRAQQPERAASLDYYGGRFRISVNYGGRFRISVNNVSSRGCSHGVAASVASHQAEGLFRGAEGAQCAKNS